MRLGFLSLAILLLISSVSFAGNFTLLKDAHFENFDTRATRDTLAGALDTSNNYQFITTVINTSNSVETFAIRGYNGLTAIAEVETSALAVLYPANGGSGGHLVYVSDSNYVSFDTVGTVADSEAKFVYFEIDIDTFNGSDTPLQQPVVNDGLFLNYFAYWDSPVSADSDPVRPNAAFDAPMLNAGYFVWFRFYLNLSPNILLGIYQKAEGGAAASSVGEVTVPDSVARVADKLRVQMTAGGQHMCALYDTGLTDTLVVVTGSNYTYLPRALSVGGRSVDTSQGATVICANGTLSGSSVRTTHFDNWKYGTTQVVFNVTDTPVVAVAQPTRSGAATTGATSPIFGNLLGILGSSRR